MADKKYKALFVLEPVHYEVVVEAKKARRTINDFIFDLLEIYKKKLIK